MPSKLYKILIILGAAAVLTAAFLFINSKYEENYFEVDFLDVGQGDSILIKTEAGQNILIDGGPDATVVKRLGENLPWWDRTIDLMILTHPHSDHVGGLIHVLNRYKVERVLYTGVTHTIPEYLEWLQIIKDKDISLKIIDHPQRINFGEKSYLEIIYPFESLAGEIPENLNNSSIVVMLNYEDNKILLAGDIEEKIEEELLEVNVDLEANIFKANHHGSDGSNTEEFLNAVNPEIVVIPVGADNSFGHPNGRILKRFESLGAEIYRTDIDGTVKIEIDGKNLKIKNRGE